MNIAAWVFIKACVKLIGKQIPPSAFKCAAAEQRDFNPARIIYLISVLLLALDFFVLQTEITIYVFRIMGIFHSCSLCFFLLLLFFFGVKTKNDHLAVQQQSCLF